MIVDNPARELYDCGQPYTGVIRLWTTLHRSYMIVDNNTPELYDCGQKYTGII